MNVKVTKGSLSERELALYVELAKKKHGDNLVGLEVAVDDDEHVSLTYTLKSDVPFERIRRITGYLVGTMDKWNDAKRAEEHDRVKHEV